MSENETRVWKTPEFFLVVVMLVVFTGLVGYVMKVALDSPQSSLQAVTKIDSLQGATKEEQIKFIEAQTKFMEAETKFSTDKLEYRKNILSLIITAFGAWIGAGAAYFFGRENLKEATNLALRGLLPKERLRKTLIRELPLKPFDWLVKEDEPLKEVMNKLRDQPDRWFIPIINADGTLKNIIHEEAIWRFVDNESTKTPPTAYNEIMEKKVLDALNYLTELQKQDPDKWKRVVEIYVTVRLDENADAAHESMMSKEVYIAVIKDEKGRPTHYVTTGDIRTVLLQAA